MIHQEERFANNHQGMFSFRSAIRLHLIIQISQRSSLKEQQNQTVSQGQCKDQSAIDNYFENEKFNFAFVNTFFDFTDFKTEESAIKYFIDDTFFFELEASKAKKQNIFLQLQEATMEDDYLQFGQKKLKQFHQVVNQRSYDDGYQDEKGYIVAIYLRLDSSYNMYRRKVYSVLELLGDLGGLYRSLYIIGLWFVGSIAHHLFLSDVMNKIYQVRKPIENDESLQRQNNTNNTVSKLQNETTNEIENRFAQFSKSQIHVRNPSNLNAMQNKQTNNLTN
ncbi:UNKNOWN [Stylonychia lemnae]|uniref:Uncharacterized protein n=1 Tax=Stylonychia lemnae TaxID=5949 RepID=A0A078B5Z4_STYLE|nr:UNKNOWN [Stylonychia lemnae]|eukprot:CDW89839.1 UNKNOWN [Stylonychia lemnae]